VAPSDPGEGSTGTEQATLNLLLNLSGLPKDPMPHLGVELWFGMVWFGGLGLGLRAGLDGAGGMITLGSSVWLESLRVDWAFAAHPRLPDTNRAS